MRHYVLPTAPDATDKISFRKVYRRTFMNTITKPAINLVFQTHVYYIWNTFICDTQAYKIYQKENINYIPHAN